MGLYYKDVTQGKKYGSRFIFSLSTTNPYSPTISSSSIKLIDISPCACK